MSKEVAINLADKFSLLAVWSLADSDWKLLKITRLRPALALAQEPGRLVFPTHLNPNKIWGSRPRMIGVAEPEIKPLTTQEVVWERIKSLPGQTSGSLALQLGLGLKNLHLCLRELKKKSLIHHHPCPLQSRARLYYPGTAPAATGSKTSATTSKVILPARKKPPLKVYFVDPRTLQDISRTSTMEKCVKN